MRALTYRHQFAEFIPETLEEGVVYVVAEGFEFKLLGKSELGEECMATPAVSRGVLYYRTRGHLTAIGK